MLFQWAVFNYLSSCISIASWCTFLKPKHVAINKNDIILVVVDGLYFSFYCQKYRQLPGTSDIRHISLRIEFHCMLYSYKHKIKKRKWHLKIISTKLVGVAMRVMMHTHRTLKNYGPKLTPGQLGVLEEYTPVKEQECIVSCQGNLSSLDICTYTTHLPLKKFSIKFIA